MRNLYQVAEQLRVSRTTEECWHKATEYEGLRGKAGYIWDSIFSIGRLS